MKKYFYSAIAASMLFACSQEEIVDVTGGESQVKTFKVEIPQLESRTVGGIELGKGTQANNLIYAMYENGSTETEPLITGMVTDVDSDGEDNGEFIVKVPMAKDLKYDLLFFAYNAENSAFEIESEAKDTNLKNLKFKADQTANIDAFDAFVGSLKAQGVNDPNTVSLKRPFAQINAATTEADLDNATTLKLNVTKSNLVIKGVPQYYDVLNATASGSVDVTYAASPIMECDGPNASNQAYPNEMIEVDGINYYYLTLAYVLAGEVTTTSTHNATFEFQRENGTPVSTLEIVSLPIQRNYRTNVVGDLLTKSEEYTISIDANFGGAHVVGVWDGTKEEVEDTDNDGTIEITNASQLAYIAEQVDGGKTYSGKTIKLMNNIDLGNIAWNPIGVSGDSNPFSGTFDGNGKTISNLYVDLTDEPLYESAGLFANASGATIKNFTIQNAYVANRTVFGASSCGTAIVAGSGQGTTTIENVDVKDATIVADRYAGGIAGFYQGTIKDCDVDGIQITVKPNLNTEGTAYDNGDKVGGIIGYVNSSGTLTNNTVNDFTIRAYRDMGGIVGGNYANVDGNKATNGTITVDQLTNSYGAKSTNAGEIVGRQLGGTVGTNTHENVTIITLTEQNYVTSQESFEAALSAGGKIYLGKSTASRAVTADYVWKQAAKSFEIIAVEEGVVIDMNNATEKVLCANASVAASFEGVTLNYTNVDYAGFHHSTSETYKNCHINGVVWTYAPKATFEGCTFNQTGDAYNIWMYGAATNEISVKGCEFTSYCKSILIYSEGVKKYDVTIENSTFNSANYDNKAAVQMHTEGGINGTLTMNNVTVSGAYLQFPSNGGLYNEINKSTGLNTNNFKKIINGVTYIADGLSSAKKNTYDVSNANGLATLNQMMADKTAGHDAVVNLTADINFEGKTWTPVDSHADTKFEIAEINGNGHTISNLTINGQAMFTRFAGSGNVVIKNVTFDNATVNSTALNTSILTVQSYQNVLLDNVDVKNSTITGTYKVAPLIATVYDEKETTVTATLKNCDVENVTVKSTQYDFCTAGMVAFVYEGNNDKIEFENCTVKDVKLMAKPNGYASHAAIYVNDADTDDCINNAEGVTVINVTFEELN